MWRAEAVLNLRIDWACASPALNSILHALLCSSVSKKGDHLLLHLCLQVDLYFKLFPFEDLLASYSDVVLGKDQSIK